MGLVSIGLVAKFSIWTAKSMLVFWRWIVIIYLYFFGIKVLYEKNPKSSYAICRCH